MARVALLVFVFLSGLARQPMLRMPGQGSEGDKIT